MILGRLVDQHVEIRLDMIGELVDQKFYVKGSTFPCCLLWLLSLNYQLNRTRAIC